MYGLEQIKAMNENPTEHAKKGMSDGQRRRNDDKGKAFWSESAANADDGHYTGPINPVGGSEWGPTVEDQIKSPVGSFKRATQEERNLLNEDAFRPVQSPYTDIYDNMNGSSEPNRTVNGLFNYHDFDVIAGEVVRVPSKDKIMAAMNRPDTFKVVTQPAEGIVHEGMAPKTPLPPIYFDAVQLQSALSTTAQQAAEISHRLQVAIRAVQHATSETALRANVVELNRMVSCIMHRNPVLDLNLLIGLLETETEKLSPAIEPQGNPYRPRHGLDHAMHPIKRIVGKMKLAMTKWALETDG